MWFSKPAIIILLKAKSLEVWHRKKQGPIGMLEFPGQIVRNQEVLNGDELMETVGTFIQQLPFKPQKAIVCLSSEVVYKKVFPSGDQEMVQKVQEFFEAIPFLTEQLTCKLVAVNKQRWGLATPKGLYQSVIEIFKKKGWHIEYAVPLGIFVSFEQEQVLTIEMLKNIFKNTKLMQKSNFLNFDKMDLQPGKIVQIIGKKDTIQKNARHGYKGLIVAGVFLLTILLVGGAWGWHWGWFGNSYEKGRLTQPMVPISSTVTPVPVEELVATESAEINTEPEVIQTDLGIRILNGSGVAGQAMTMSNLLEKEGFTSIQIGNASTALSTSASDRLSTSSAENKQGATIVAYADGVNNTTKELIEQRLQEVFEEISVGEEALEGDYQIEIITGKVL